VKKLFVFISGLFAYSFLALPAFAETITVDPCSSTATNPITNPIAIALCSLGGNNFARTLQNIVVFFVILTVIIALLYLIYGGVKWITSKGDKTEVESARNHIMAAIVGLIIVILAVLIVSIILAAFGISFSQLTIPTITKTYVP
jgi:hypothetical protein